MSSISTKSESLRQLLIDGVGLIGLGLLSYGAYLIYEPASFVIAGLLLLAFSVRASS